MLTGKIVVQVATACVIVGALAALAGPREDPQDVKGSHDLPAFPRVPGYYISAYEERKSDSKDFCRQDPVKHVRIQGRSWQISYKRAGSATSPSGAQVRRYYQTLFRKAHAQPICDADPDLDARVTHSGSATWVHLRAFAPGDSYELEIIERAAP